MKLLKKIYHVREKIRLRHRYRGQLAQLNIIEEIITEEIIAGNTSRREELNKIQQTIKSTEQFLIGIKKIK